MKKNLLHNLSSKDWLALCDMVAKLHDKQITSLVFETFLDDLFNRLERK